MLIRKGTKMVLRKTLLFFLCSILSSYASPVFATGDGGNTSQNLFRVIAAIQETLKNVETVTQQDKLIQLLGEKGVIPVQLMEIKAKIDANIANPVVTKDFANLLSKGDYANALPKVKALTMDALKVTKNDVAKYQEALETINARLSVTGLETMKMAKTMEALSNQVISEANQQLSVVDGTKDFQERLAQVTSQHVQGIRYEMGLNQMQAKMLEMLAVQGMKDVETVDEETEEENSEEESADKQNEA